MLQSSCTVTTQASSQCPLLIAARPQAKTLPSVRPRRIPNLHQFFTRFEFNFTHSLSTLRGAKEEHVDAPQGRRNDACRTRTCAPEGNRFLVYRYNHSAKAPIHLEAYVSITTCCSWLLVVQSATTAWNKGKHQLCWWLAGLEKVEDLRSLKMTCRSNDIHIFMVVKPGLPRVCTACRT